MSRRVVRLVWAGAFTLLGALGANYLINNYTDNRVENAVETRLVPLRTEADSLKNLDSLLAEKVNFLSGNVAKLEDSLKTVTSDKEILSRVAMAALQNANKIKTSKDSIENVTNNLLASYPSEIRENSYVYTQTLQNGLVVGQLDIMALKTEDPQELARRYGVFKNFNVLYPGLLDRAEKEGNSGIKRLRLSETEKQIYDVRKTAEDETRNNFEYKHLKLINNGYQEKR